MPRAENQFSFVAGWPQLPYSIFKWFNTSGSTSGSRVTIMLGRMRRYKRIMTYTEHYLDAPIVAHYVD